MIARIIFWKKFKKLIFGCFAILFGVITCCLLGSWTITQDTNNQPILKSDNLCDSVIIRGAYQYNTGVYGLSNVNYFCTQNYIELNSNEFYTFSFSSNSFTNFGICIYNLSNTWLGTFSNLQDRPDFIFSSINVNYDDVLDIYYVSFSFGSNYEYGQDTYYANFSVGNSTFLNVIPTFMVNKGKSPLPYEDYNLVSDNKYYANIINEFYRYYYYEQYLPLNNCSIANNSQLVSILSNQSIPNCSIGLINEGSYLVDNKTYFFESTNSNIQAIIEYYDNNNNRFTITNKGFITWHTNYNITGIYFVNDTNNIQYTNLYLIDTGNFQGVSLSQYASLSSLYSQLQQDYNDYVSNHTYTDTQYNDLLQRYNELYNSGSIDITQFHLSVASQNSAQNIWSFDDVTDLSSSSYIDGLGYLDVDSIYNIYIDGDINALIVHLDNPVNVMNYDLMFNNNSLGNNINLLIKLDYYGTISTNLYSVNSTNVNPNETYTLSNFIKYTDSSLGVLTNYTYQDFAIIWTNVGNSLSNVKLNGQGDYNLGFVNGVAQNNKVFVDLQNDYNDLSTNYDTLDARYDALLDQYNSLANSHLELSMRNLVWYIASTPFESFKSIWSVDFLGLNIASFFTGLFSVFIIVWILKKIF